MESVVDIFEVIKAIRIQKPGAIQTVVSPYNNSVHTWIAVIIIIIVIIIIVAIS